MLFKTKSMIRKFARWAFIVILLVIPLARSSLLLIPDFIAPDDRILHVLTVTVFFLAGIGLLHFAFWEKFFAYVKITDDGILWKCPLRKTRFLKKEDCLFIGVETENPGQDMYPFIYFSAKPYPQENKGKISKLKCSDLFIKFWYLDLMADYVLEHFPKEQTHLVAEFKKKARTYFD